MAMNIIPQDEHQRMAAVKRYDILDTPPDGAFDRITAIAAKVQNAHFDHQCRRSRPDLVQVRSWRSGESDPA
jgi:hypothetical protein